MKLFLIFFLCGICIGAGFAETNHAGQPVYLDKPYWQDYAVKYYADSLDGRPVAAAADRNDVVQVLTDKGLFLPFNGRLQIPGTLEPDRRHRPMADKRVKHVIVYDDQFVYLDDEAVFSNAWAGKLYIRHNMPDAKTFSGGRQFDFLLTNGHDLLYVTPDGPEWHSSLGSPVLQIEFDNEFNRFLVLTENEMFALSPADKKMLPIHSGSGLTCFEVLGNGNLLVGTKDGYYPLSANGWKAGTIQNRLPWPELTAIREVRGQLWFGSTKGAFMMKEDGKFNYYFGERWLPGNNIVDIAPGPDGSVLILTDQGLGQIRFKKMTLEDKALFYEKQVRQRHIRYGFNSTGARLQNHDISTAQTGVADSDNLWTAMYLGSQLFRWLATGSEQAKQNCYEAFEAMERLHEINGIPGLFGRTFERRGYQEFRKEFRSYVDNYWYEGYQGTISWRHAEDPEWDWRASASSDQTVGQIFALTLIAQYIDDDAWRNRAIELLDSLVGYIVANDMCLVDYNGKPSLWGRWNPQYVNRFDTMIGDRKICSSNIIAFLQTAYHFTKKEIYKEKALELMEEHGYLENLMRPFSEIGQAPEDADAWSKMLSEEWNHSDDEMYFLAYWGLYPYAFNDELKEKYRQAIEDHWQWERPEKNALWNFCYAMTGAREFDLDESVWHLKEFPLDMIQYAVQNSHRQDIEFVEPNFWGQTTREMLPPDERPELKHNRNLFTLDAGDRGSELSAGDTFLLPYWMGRFLGVISAPVE